MLSSLLRAVAQPSWPTPVEAAWAEHRVARRALATPFLRAIDGGGRAGSIGVAFATGYRAAFDVLCPEVPPDRLVALCASEKGGAHPRAIETRARGGVLEGRKRFVTMGPLAEELLVVAREDESEAQPKLGVYRVPRDRAGVRVVPMPELPFVPEIPHGELFLEGVAITAADRLAGDGYERYLKPFRTIEDVFAHAAVLAYAAREVTRRRGPETLVEDIFAALWSFERMAAGDPTDRELHLCLASSLRGATKIFEAMEEWAEASAPDLHATLTRDRPLLSVASDAREKRRKRAWERVRAPQ